MPPASEVPPPPAHFTKPMRERWEEVCAELIKRGTLADADAHSVRLYVEADALCLQAWGGVVKAGMWKDNRTTPQYRAWLEASKMMDRLQDKLGFSPRARMGLKTEAPKDTGEGDPLAAIIKKMNNTA